MPAPQTTAERGVIGRLGVVLTGGTIAAQATASSGKRALTVVRDGKGRTPERGVLELALQRAGTADAAIVQPMAELSENLTPADWVRIAEAVRTLVEQEGAHSVLILHGTDTMAYTAAALSFLLADLRVPIVLSGANLPARDARSDAARNVADALTALRWLRDGVYVVFAGSRGSPGWVHVGTCVRKVSVSGRAFASMNRRPAGKVTDGDYVPIEPLRREPRPFRASVLDERVLGVRLYPGLDLEAVSGMLTARGFAGVVLELYASATAPARTGRHSAPEFARRCLAAGIAVVAAAPTFMPSAVSASRAKRATSRSPTESATSAGAATSTSTADTYETTVRLRDAGALLVGDMLPETALVKLMWALPQVSRARELASTMLDPVAEELR